LTVRRIGLRDLQHDSAAIMRAVERGETFVLTRRGRPVADLVPHRGAMFVSAEEAVAALAFESAIDFERFRADVESNRIHELDPRA
jgi:prevent-host-death family protein